MATAIKSTKRTCVGCSKDFFYREGPDNSLCTNCYLNEALWRERDACGE